MIHLSVEVSSEE
jgi:hypothetical protein